MIPPDGFCRRRTTSLFDYASCTAYEPETSSKIMLVYQKLVSRSQSPGKPHKGLAPTAGAGTVHLPTGVRAALGWSPQRRHLDARSPAATLQDSLMARLDRLAPVREIAQTGAAIGREFSYSLVRALVGRDETALKDGLAQLEQAGLVFCRGEPPDAVYSFKHALVRMRACSRAAGSNCTARLRAYSSRALPTSWRASRKSWRSTSWQLAWLTPPSITGSTLAISRSVAQRMPKP